MSYALEYPIDGARQENVVERKYRMENKSGETMQSLARLEKLFTRHTTPTKRATHFGENEKHHTF